MNPGRTIQRALAPALRIAGLAAREAVVDPTGVSVAQVAENIRRFQEATGISVADLLGTRAERFREHAHWSFKQACQPHLSEWTRQTFYRVALRCAREMAAGSR